MRFAGAPLSRDHLRVGYLRLDGEAVDMRGIGPGGATGWHLTGSLELRRGLDVLGASPNCLGNPARCAAPGFVPPSLVDGDPTATVLRFAGQAEVRVLRRISFAVLPRFQVSSAPLLSFEQISAGNYTVGRGFDPGTLSGDSGAGFAAEIRADQFRVLPKADVSAAPYAFVDAAWIYNRNTPANTDPRQVTSAGIGARAAWSDHARLDATLAVPVHRSGPGTGGVRFLVSLTTRLAPWGAR